MMPINLDPYFMHLPAWLLVLFRLSGIVVTAPLFGARAIPVRIRALWAVALSLCVYPMLLEVGRPARQLLMPILSNGLGLWSIAPAVVAELLIGLIIGYGAGLPMIGMQVSGRIVDQQLGTALGGVFNPDLDEQTAVFSEFYFLLALTVFVILGGHRVMITTLVGSFDVIPLGGFRPDLTLLELLIGMMGTIFNLAVCVAAPLLCLIFLETLAMGFIVRTVPQINVLSVGFPLRILLGIGLLIASLAIGARVFVEVAERVMSVLASYLG